MPARETAVAAGIDVGVSDIVQGAGRADAYHGDPPLAAIVLEPVPYIAALVGVEDQDVRPGDGRKAIRRERGLVRPERADVGREIGAGVLRVAQRVRLRHHQIGAAGRSQHRRVVLRKEHREAQRAEQFGRSDAAAPRYRGRLPLRRVAQGAVVRAHRLPERGRAREGAHVGHAIRAAPSAAV
jgi:hypothetical protein